MQADLNTILPEIVISVYAMLALLGAVYTSKDKLAGLVTYATAGLLLLVAAWIGLNGSGATTAFGGMFVDDAFARFAKVTILLSAAAVLVMGIGYLERHKMMKFEYPILVALSVVGMMFMVSAGDLMALYMGLELQSLALYVIAAMRRDSLRSTEAGLSISYWGLCPQACCSMVLRWCTAMPARRSSQALWPRRAMGLRLWAFYLVLSL